MPAKSKLTPELETRICELIKDGLCIRSVCNVLRISKSSFYNWRSTKVAFLDSTKKAESESELEIIKLIREAAKKNWQAGAWYLERKFPDRWGRKEHLTIGNLDLSDLSTEELAELREYIVGRNNGPGER